MSTARGLGVHQVVVKSQILAGGRGLGTFKNGFKSGVHIVKVDQAVETAKKMLGQVLVTKQTGPGGKPVGTLFIASKMDLAKEMYFAILTDRASAQVLMIGCGEGERASAQPPNMRDRTQELRMLTLLRGAFGPQ